MEHWELEHEILKQTYRSICAFPSVAFSHLLSDSAFHADIFFFHETMLAPVKHRLKHAYCVLTVQNVKVMVESVKSGWKCSWVNKILHYIIMHHIKTNTLAVITVWQNWCSIWSSSKKLQDRLWFRNPSLHPMFIKLTQKWATVKCIQYKHAKTHQLPWNSTVWYLIENIICQTWYKTIITVPSSKTTDLLPPSDWHISLPNQCLHTNSSP